MNSTKKLWIIGSAVGGLALSVNLAWANCGVQPAKPRTQTISCQSTRSCAPSPVWTVTGTAGIRTISINVQGGDGRSHNGNSQGFGTNGLSLGGDCFVSQSFTGLKTDACNSDVGFHDLVFTASLFPSC
jgi:hypothetical protein